MKKGVSIILRAGAVILFVGYLAAVAWHGLCMPPAGLPLGDETEWAWKAVVLPYPEASGDEYDREATVPSLYRWYAGAVQTGKDELIIVVCKRPGSPLIDVVGYVPPVMQDRLRLASVGLYAAMLGLLWLVGLKALGKAALALLALVPVAASPTFWNCVAWRIGPDALLCLMLVASLAAWLWLAGRTQLVVVSILAGLACASKQNGVLVLGAYCCYLALAERGWSRLWKPAAATLTAGVVFCLVNPATWSGPWNFFLASVHMRMLCAQERAMVYGPHTWWQFLNDALPTWPLVPVFGWLLWRCRGENWFAPVAWWGGFLAIGTLVPIPSPETRYLAPLEMGLYFPAALCAMHLVSRWGGRFQKAGGAP